MDDRILRAKLILKGFKVDEFIEKVNENGKVLDRSKYYRALRGDGEFDRKEIESIRNALELTDEEVVNIFFK